MAHPDHEQLVLIALGDLPFDAAFEAHLAGCDACTEEYLAMQRVALIGRQTEDLRDLPEPPEQVWQRIAAQAFAPPTDAGVPAGPVGGRTPSAAGPGGPGAADLAGADGRHAAGRPGSDRRGPDPGQPAGGPRPPTSTANGTGPGRAVAARHPAGSTRRRPRSGLARIVLAAVVGLLIGVGATVGVAALRGGSGSPSDTVVAAGTFTPKAAVAQAATGTVTVVQTPTGRQLRITVDGMPTPQGIYEAWLYNPGNGAMIPLGAMGVDGGQYDVTAFDLGAYSVVDVSAQSFDGTQGHGQSVLQAPLG